MEMRAIKREDIPGFANRNNPTARLLKEFLEGDADCVEIVKMATGLNGTASKLRNTVSNAKLPIQVMQRDKRLFLIKKGAANVTDT